MAIGCEYLMMSDPLANTSVLAASSKYSSVDELYRSQVRLKSTVL